MADTTKIEWTATIGPDGTVHPGYTFNPWIGCSKCAVGCEHCYAEADFDKRRHVAQWGPNGTRVLTSPANWKKPLAWNRKAEKLGVRLKVFCASLADVFEAFQHPMVDAEWRRLAVMQDGETAICESQPAYTMDAARRDLFALIDATPHLDWLVLTKRPENIKGMWRPRILHDDPEHGKLGTDQRPNVWLGTSISTQADADRNIPELLKCRDLAAKLFVNAEPLVESIDLTTCCITRPHEMMGLGGAYWCDGYAGIEWLIIGGESGPHARTCEVQWLFDIIKDCADAGVPYFVKQLGSKASVFEARTDEFQYDVIEFYEEVLGRIQKPDCWFLPLKHPKGGDPAEWPPDLRVREWP